MRIFDYFFNRYGIPLLVLGSTGTGIKLYFGKVGYLTYGDSQIFNSLEGEENADRSSQAGINIVSQPTAIVQPPKPKKTTFADKIDSRFKVFSEQTTEEVIRNVMFQRLYPNKDEDFSYSATQLFAGGIKFDFKAKSLYTKDNAKELKTIEKPENTEVDKYREACLKALNTEYPSDKDESGQISKLREWCTEPKVQDVLSRHKFHVFSDSRYEKEIEPSIKKILVGWFKKEGETKWWEKQSFFSEDEVKQILKGKEEGFKSESEIEKEQVEFVKQKCLQELDKNFERKNFYLTKDFIDQMNDPSDLKVDLFQEVAIFCSVPTTAESYVNEAMQGILKTTFTEKEKEDYCYIEGKEPQDYKTISTTDPFEGKTFWCAVRLLYETKPKES
ncbi:hypothetical protein [Candidatus Mycoplasma haematohominis]|uniref:hypothetical protein n=1 Tax=Candidatus Mycoplasma haematohominis TaxID=1494318 RepID=UPI001C0A72CA|nr:hypothetical protein [Candidatus Mycoplasma haemohominis]